MRPPLGKLLRAASLAIAFALPAAELAAVSKGDVEEQLRTVKNFHIARAEQNVQAAHTRIDSRLYNTAHTSLVHAQNYLIDGQDALDAAMQEIEQISFSFFTGKKRREEIRQGLRDEAAVLQTDIHNAEARIVAMTKDIAELAQFAHMSIIRSTINELPSGSGERARLEALLAEIKAMMKTDPEGAQARLRELMKDLINNGTIKENDLPPAVLQDLRNTSAGGAGGAPAGGGTTVDPATSAQQLNAFGHQLRELIAKEENPYARQIMVSLYNDLVRALQQGDLATARKLMQDYQDAQSDYQQRLAQIRRAYQTMNDPGADPASRQRAIDFLNTIRPGMTVADIIALPGPAGGRTTPQRPTTPNMTPEQKAQAAINRIEAVIARETDPDIKRILQAYLAEMRSDMIAGDHNGVVSKDSELQEYIARLRELRALNIAEIDDYIRRLANAVGMKGSAAFYGFDDDVADLIDQVNEGRTTPGTVSTPGTPGTAPGDHVRYNPAAQDMVETFPPNFTWENNVLGPKIERAYIGGEGARLVSEREISLKREPDPQDPTLWKVTEVLGDTRQWNFNVQTVQTQTQPDGLKATLRFSDPAFNDFTVTGWTVTDSSGNVIPGATSANDQEYALTFSKTDAYNVQVTGETAWGSPFRFSTSVNVNVGN